MASAQPDRDPADVLARLERQDIVGRLFPEIVPPMPQGMPGRSWIAGRQPPRPTDLDDAVTELLSRRADPRVLSAGELVERGISCPYYAVRSYAALAFQKAAIDHKAYATERVTRLKNQERTLQARLDNTRDLLQYQYTEAMMVGNMYWVSADQVRAQRLAVERDGKAAFDAIVAETEAVKAYLGHVREEIARIAPPEGRPLAWNTSFVRTMGSVYCALTGADTPPDDGKHFTNLLTQATLTVGGKEGRIRSWGQTRALLRRMQAESPGGEAGGRSSHADVRFDEGTRGALSLDLMERVEERGPEVAALAAMAQVGDAPGAAAMAIIALRDRDDTPERIVLREVVLKPALERAGRKSPALLGQLGWQNDQRHEVQRALLKVLASGRAGDAKAVATLELAREAEEPVVQVALGQALGEPFSLLDRGEVMYRLHPRARKDTLAEVLSVLLQASDPLCAAANAAARVRMMVSEPAEEGLLRRREAGSTANFQHYLRMKSAPTPTDIVRRQKVYPKDI